MFCIILKTHYILRFLSLLTLDGFFGINKNQGDKDILVSSSKKDSKKEFPSDKKIELIFSIQQVVHRSNTYLHDYAIFN